MANQLNCLYYYWNIFFSKKAHVNWPWIHTICHLFSVWPCALIHLCVPCYHCPLIQQVSFNFLYLIKYTMYNHICHNDNSWHTARHSCKFAVVVVIVTKSALTSTKTILKRLIICVLHLVQMTINFFLNFTLSLLFPFGGHLFEFYCFCCCLFPCDSLYKSNKTFLKIIEKIRKFAN